VIHVCDSNLDFNIHGLDVINIDYSSLSSQPLKKSHYQISMNQCIQKLCFDFKWGHTQTYKNFQWYSRPLTKYQVFNKKRSRCIKIERKEKNFKLYKKNIYFLKKKELIKVFSHGTLNIEPFQ